MATAKKLNEVYQNFLEKNCSEEEFLKVLHNHAMIVISKERKLAHLKEDIAQDVVLYVWRKHLDFQGKSSFSTWVYSITKSFALWMLRKEAKEAAYISVGTLYDLELFLEEYMAENDSAEGLVSRYTQSFFLG